MIFECESNFRAMDTPQLHRPVENGRVKPSGADFPHMVVLDFTQKKMLRKEDVGGHALQPCLFNMAGP